MTKQLELSWGCWSKLGFGAILNLVLLSGLVAQTPPVEIDPTADNTAATATLPADSPGSEDDLLAELHALESKWEREVRAESKDLAELKTLIDASRAQLKSDEPRLSSFLDRSVTELDRQIDLLEDLLAKYAAPSEVDRLVDSWERPRARSKDLSFREMVESATELSPELESTAHRLRAREKELRWEALLDHASEASKLNRLRVQAIEDLPDTRRLAIYSLSPQGVQHLGLELRMLKLSLFSLARSRFEQSTNLIRLTTDLVAAGTFSLVLARAILVLFGWFVLSRWRTTRIEDQGRVARSSAGRWLKAEGRWVVHLAGLWALRWALGPASTWPMVAIGLQSVIIYAIYRAALDLLVGALTYLGRRSNTSFAARYHERLFVSVRWIVRISAVFWLLRWIVSSRIGEAVAYAALGWIRSMIVLIVTVVVAIPWRKELEDSYLRNAPVGLLIPWVKRNRESKKGLLALPYILVWFAVQTAATALRDLALRFGQSRRAVAFLFRRRIERQAGQRGYAEVSLSNLPKQLVEALDETITVEDCEATGRLGGFDRALEAAEEWSNGGPGGAFILAGSVGMGEKAWLDSFVASAPGDPTRLALNERLLDEEDLFAWLSKKILEPSDSGLPLAQALLEGPRRIVILEHGENLFLTRIDGYRAVDGLANLVEKTGRNVFWVLSFGAQAWRHLQASGASLASLGHIQMLEPWTDEEIRQLLHQRLARSGFTLSWKELASGGHHDPLPEDLESAEVGYTRLLWDYADGNPSIALHFFLRSLVPLDDGIISVRLFKFPSESRLLELGDDALFLLARLLVHRTLDIYEAAATIVSPVRKTRILAGGLEDLGALEPEGSGQSVSLHWQAACKRLLKRRNLLVT